MLPEIRYTGPANDDKFITDELYKLPQSWRQGACAKYSEVFEQEGRRAANTKLRQYVIRVNNR